MSKAYIYWLFTTSCAAAAAAAHSMLANRNTGQQSHGWTLPRAWDGWGLCVNGGHLIALRAHSVHVLVCFIILPGYLSITLPIHLTK